MSYKPKTFEELAAMSPADLLAFHSSDNEPGDFYRLEYGDLLAKALAKALAATPPAPASDALLSELEQAINEAQWAQLANKPDARRKREDAENAAYNAAPALLARVRAAEAHSATLQGALESSADTNRVLAERLKKAANVLEGYEKWEASVLEEDAAWANRQGQPWGTQELYDEWMELQAQRNAILRPTVKGGQPNA